MAWFKFFAICMVSYLIAVLWEIWQTNKEIDDIDNGRV